MTGRQQHRSNVTAATAQEYYKRVLTIPMLDYLLSEMEKRFQSDTPAIVSQIMLLMPSTLAGPEKTPTSADIAGLVPLYGNDLPAPGSLDTELHLWSVKWRDRSQDAASFHTPVKTLAAVDSDFFPNIEQLLKIACTLAVTSCECERSISHLRILKTRLRSTMTETRLNGLALLYAHRDIACDAATVVDEYARRHPRRLQLINPFTA